MVAGLNRPEEIDPGGVRKMLRLINSLRDSPAGSVIYRQLECMLDEVAASHLKVEIAYAGFVSSLLEAFATHLTPGSSRYVQVKLLQARLQPPLTATELNTLSEFVAQCADNIRDTHDVGTSTIYAAINPLLRSFGIEELVTPATRVPGEQGGADTPEFISEAATVRSTPPAIRLNDEMAVAEAEADLSPDEAEYEAEADLSPAEAEYEAGADLPPEEREDEAGADLPPEEREDEAGADLSPEERDDEAGADLSPVKAEDEIDADLSPDDTEEEFETGEVYEAGDDADTPRAPGLGDDDYHYELDARREDIRQLQSNLGQQVMETISQNEEFGVILEVVLAELRQAEEVTGIENARWTLIREVDKLMKGHNELADKLDSTHHYLQLIESDSRELTDELSRVRMLSLTDELTGLANRRAFMRRLEDEVARVQRYGFPLSFALMDLDHFKGINDEYGHAAGDEVLRVYSKNILSVFRHHDMVARYGGEEFAVLLPNTDADGAIRALNKVRRRAAETRWQSNGTISQVPSFSAGVSLFKPGESASAFIERADKALYRAKHLGRDRIELDITYETEESHRLPRRRSTDL
jgi:diguanylate cyclase (GGDEF)-like protein